MKSFIIISILFFSFCHLPLISNVNGVYSPFIPILEQSNFEGNYLNSNPAYTTDSSNTLSLLVSPSIHGISELNSGTVFYSTKIAHFRPGIGFSGINSNLYQEYSASFQLSYDLSNKITIGSRISYNSINIENYSGNNYFSLDIGAKSTFSEFLSAGFMLSNINGGSFEDDSDNIFRTAAFALGGNLTDELNMEIGVIIRNYSQSGISLTGKYVVIKNILEIGGGFLTRPQAFQVLARLNAFDDLNIIFSMNFKQYLEPNKNIAIMYDW
jgi:hypothetical protein